MRSEDVGIFCLYDVCLSGCVEPWLRNFLLPVVMVTDKLLGWFGSTEGSFCFADILTACDACFYEKLHSTVQRSEPPLTSLSPWNQITTLFSFQIKILRNSRSFLKLLFGYWLLFHSVSVLVADRGICFKYKNTPNSKDQASLDTLMLAACH